MRGERCLWIWLSKLFLDGDNLVSLVLWGHVDDVHRLGGGSAEWLETRKQIDNMYNWGITKTGPYRHAGIDGTTTVDDRGYQQITVDSNCYLETLQDAQIEPERMAKDLPATKGEIDACRTALGALPWLAVQSQPQLCSRCNLLLTELATTGRTTVAKAIQMMIGEVRAEAFTLQFRKIESAKHGSEIVFISMSDQAHNNRPQGDSTGGLIALLAGQESLSGQVCAMTVIAWRTWKLKRQAIGSNDAEVQAILEAEDQNFRARLLDFFRPRRLDLVECTEAQVRRVQGVLALTRKAVST